MREGWERTTLGALCTITRGTSPTQKTPPGRYPLIVTGPEPLSSDSFQFDGEAVCVPLVSSTGHGHASLKRVHYASGRFAVANIIAACVPRDSAAVDVRFLFHYLQHFKDAEIVTRMKGTANVSLSVTNLAMVPINLPPLSEQRRIVDLIGAVDDAQNAAEAEATSLDTLLGLLRTHLFSRYEEVEVSTLIEKIEGGRSVQAANRPPGRGEIGVIKLSAVNERGFVPSESKTLTSADGFTDRMLIRAGDVLITRANTSERVGTTCLVDAVPGGLYLSDKTLRIIPNAGVTPETLVHALQSTGVRAQFSAFATGTSASMQNISQKDIGRARVGWPPSTRDQVRLGNTLSAHVGSAAAARATAEALRSLRGNLLTVLLSGEHQITPSYDALLEEIT